MLIGYDGKRAVHNNTGLGNYSRLLASVMAAQYPDDRFILYSPRPKVTPRLEPVLEHPNVELRGPRPALWGIAPSLWRTTAMGRQMRADGVELIHGLSGELPAGVERLGIPSVVTVHDVIFRHYPEMYRSIDRRIYDAKFSRAVHRATRVLAISECTARDVVRFYGIDPAKISVVYQGCDPQFHRPVDKAAIDAVRRKYGLHRPYIICVGTIEQRKNQILAVRGMRGIPEEYDLVLVGRRTPYADTIDSYTAQFHISDRIRMLHDVQFADLPALYAGADCSTYPSRFEGFGIPVIESLAAGTPVVVATGSCLEEAGGPDTPAVDPDDVAQWINEVKYIINFPHVRDVILRKGREYITRFSDQAMAQGTMECYRRAIDDFNHGKKY